MPAKAVRTVDALFRESLDVIDISVGGMALAMPPTEPGTRMKIALTLGDGAEHAIEVESRWAALGIVGVEFVALPADVAHEVQRYVAELLERGAAV